ncbi:hypothetical protein [Maledivibacter halophilus]|uniref:Uncharacterized protein n=1 Tax=Maledivibacter halophilus TaxID=36842 RepID=A0A1T5LWZ0_9FIRM|nr:hypothetical protein [Maledivibacter halophilus]SKC67977.1 hypothetical protein SAMN02194393_02118 [Maledivibacter halophilus]SKC71913.1 hypothetical protein SAMN02194393_02534 [Maledivibacter halophilus]SKC80088.1 hypothetical protein SAMN02194393_03429 [Maledivibacter halophilus]
MKMINRKSIMEIRQEEEEKQIQMLSELYEGMADLFERVLVLEEKVATLESK